MKHGTATVALSLFVGTLGNKIEQLQAADCCLGARCSDEVQLSLALSTRVSGLT
jgi:hypothetical protein